VVRLEQIDDVAREFVLVRLLKISGADLNLFDFDYDLTWAAFFMSAEEKVYGRYGGRDASGPDSRLSLKGLHYAMEKALEAHRRDPGAHAPRLTKPERQQVKPLRVDDYPAALRRRGRECIHCHQVYEFRRDFLQSEGKWKKDEVWVYPLPENVGLTLDVDRGKSVKNVAPDSPASRAGLLAGDLLEKLNGVAVASLADAQYGLHRAPAKGQIPVSWVRDGQTMSGQLEVKDGWRRTNITWRPSLLDILPSLSLFGEDLTVAEKKALGLSEKRLAFRQDRRVPTDLSKAGVQPGDIIVGIDGQNLEMTMLEFLAYVRRNYLVNERLTLDIIRDGQRIRVALTLR
jgi:hypothetical protein